MRRVELQVLEIFLRQDEFAPQPNVTGVPVRVPDGAGRAARGETGQSLRPCGAVQLSAGFCVVKRQLAGAVCAVGMTVVSFGISGNAAQLPTLVLSALAHFFQTSRSVNILMNTPPMTGRACMPSL